MRISDWSSDVCSSDLNVGDGNGRIRNHIGADPFTQPSMRHRHHCDVGDCRIAMQRIFDFLRADILAPAHDNILFTAAHRQEIAKSSDEHTSELQSLMRISYAVLCLKKQYHINLMQKISY